MNYMEKSPENFNPYEVRLSPELREVDLQKTTQLAYAVNPDSFEILVSKSGHAKLMRSSASDKHEFEGGWIFPSKGKISFYSGSLGEVQNKAVKEVLQASLGIYLRAA